jgi:hypothetical protein
MRKFITRAVAVSQTVEILKSGVLVGVIPAQLAESDTTDKLQCELSDVNATVREAQHPTIDP